MVMFAVGNRVTPGPPYRSGRAQLRHPALTGVFGGEQRVVAARRTRRRGAGIRVESYFSGLPVLAPFIGAWAALMFGTRALLPLWIGFSPLLLLTIEDLARIMHGGWRA
jgi:hypothetical protein